MNELNTDNELLEDPVEGQKDKLPSGTLYFMRETDHLTGQQFDYVKIGIVKGERDLASREKEHRTGNPRSISSVKEIESNAVQTLETFMHNRFAMNRVSSGEWFYLPGDSLEKAISVAEANAKILGNSIDQIRAAGESNKLAHDNQPLAKTDELVNRVIELTKIETQLSENKALRDALSKQLVNIAGEDPNFQNLFKISQTKDSSQFDGASLKKDHKDLYESFMNKESFSWSYKVSIELPSEERKEASIEGKSPSELHRDYLDAWSENAKLCWDFMILESRLLSLIGGASGIDGLIHWKRTDRRAFDKKAFEEAHPELFEKFQKNVAGKRIINVAEWASYPMPS